MHNILSPPKNIRTYLLRSFDSNREACQKPDAGDGTLCDSMNCLCGRELYSRIFAIKIEEIREKYNAFFITTYCDSDAVATGNLWSFDLKNSHRRHKRYLAKSRIDDLILFEMFEFTLQTYQGSWGNQRPIWLGHRHGFLFSQSDIGTIKKSIRRSFPNSSHGTRPVMIQPLLENSLNTSYLFKELMKTNRRVKKPNNTQGRRKHAIRKGRHLSELEDFMSENPLSEWLCFTGCQIRGGNIV